MSRQRSAEPLIQEVPELYSSRPLVLVGLRAPSLTFYLDRVPEQIERSRLGEWLGRGDSPLLVLDEADLQSIDPSLLARLRELGRAGRYCVYEVATRVRGRTHVTAPASESESKIVGATRLTAYLHRGSLP